MHVFDWLYFTQCLTSFFCINHLLLCAWFFILFYLTQMKFSLSTPLLMHLSLETLMPIVKTGLHILVELIVFCSTLTFPPFENFDHVVVSVSIDFPSYSQQDAPFHRISYDYSCADWNGLHIQWNNRTKFLFFMIIVDLHSQESYSLSKYIETLIYYWSNMWLHVAVKLHC